MTSMRARKGLRNGRTKIATVVSGEKGCWFVYLHGKQVNLGKNKDDALRTFHRLMADQGLSPAIVPLAAVTVKELHEQYFTDFERRADVRTVYVGWLPQAVAGDLWQPSG